MSETFPREPARRENMRASDADRDAVAARLRDALAEGRLDPDEHSERLNSVYSAKTLGELAPIVDDLPSGGTTSSVSREFASPRPVYGRERVVDTRGESPFVAAIMGGTTRGGTWTVPRRCTAFALMGGIELDLREARFAAREVTIYANTLMGGIGVVVPDDIDVRVNGVGIMGGFGTEGQTSSVTEPGAPVVHITGIAVMGGVSVQRRPRRHQRRRGEEREIEE